MTRRGAGGLAYLEDSMMSEVHNEEKAKVSLRKLRIGSSHIHEHKTAGLDIKECPATKSGDNSNGPGSSHQGKIKLSMNMKDT